MLTTLRIKNLALVPDLTLELEPGFNAITGETGAGKSIIMDAVEMLLGGRAETTAVRAESDRAVVEGVFKLTGAIKAEVHTILTREDLLDEPDYVTLSREVRREGRAIARINGRTVNLALLREIGALLVDVHGQTEHLSLLDVRAHPGLLDRFAGIETALDAYRATHAELQAARRSLADLRATQRDAERRIEMLTFQAEEIETARLKPSEEADLKAERDRLANAESLSTNAQEALLILDDGTPETPAITDQLGQAVAALSALARVDKTQSGLAARAESALEGLSDIAHDLRDYLENVEYNPKRLEQVEERLDLISRLQRKYGGSIESVIKFGADARAQLETITSAAGRIHDLETRETALLKDLAGKALALSQKRKAAAAKLGKGIETELDDLKMSSARFGVDFQTRPDPSGLPVEGGPPVAFDASGFDRVEFLIAPNPGEGLKPLAKIASGGETARLMLALKNVLARADQVPTLIFDEIDQGIGGRVGGVVGQKLWQLGRQHQVMCITHLPQLAAFGDQHYQVQKLVKNGRTTTHVSSVSGETRLLELAQMLGEVSEGTLQSASDILQSARAAMKS